MSRPLAPLAAVLGCAALLVAAPTGAQTRAHAAPAPSPTSSSLYLDWLSGWNPAGIDGGDALRIALDPETGTWGPAPVDDALRVSGVVPPPLVIHHPNGMIETILDPSLVDWLVVRLGPDGKAAFGCASGDEHAVLSAPAVAGPPDR